jgi:hypothetical protein
MLGIGARRHARITTQGLALLAGQRARAIHAQALARTRLATFTAVLGRGRRVDAEHVADLVGRVAIGTTDTFDAKFALVAGSIAGATVREARVRIDAGARTGLLESRTIDYALTRFADLVVEAGLIATTTMMNVEIRVDAAAVTEGLIRRGTARPRFAARRGRIRSIDELGVELTTARETEQDEQCQSAWLQGSHRRACIQPQADEIGNAGLARASVGAAASWRWDRKPRSSSRPHERLAASARACEQARSQRM